MRGLGSGRRGRVVVAVGVACVGWAAAAPAGAAGAGRTVLVSRSSTGVEGNEFSGSPSISADGRYVAFESFASNLAPGGRDATLDVFRQDVLSGRTELVSRSTAGAGGNSFSGNPSISADGRYVAFASTASNLVPGDANRLGDVFLRDVLRGRTRLVSRSTTGARGDGASYAPSVSADGRYVAFESAAANLAPGDRNSDPDVFVRDVLTGRTELVSRSSTGVQGNSASRAPSISADGRYVAFESAASNLAPGDRNGNGDVFRRDLLRGRTRLVSRSSTGAAGNNVSSFGEVPSISADGRYVAFGSLASDLVPGDTNDTYDQFIRDVFTGRTRLVSRSSTGTQGNNDSDSPSISADGRYVAFFSYATNLVPGDRTNTPDVFVRDVLTGRTRLVSRSSTGAQGNSGSYAPSISGDGRYVAFGSDASNLVPGDSNNTFDVFRRDLLG